ncbi:hypothetical protein [Proteus mirabilis]|nr:hypothetical protein [Proteus mirabilis]MCZ4599575.1 hypothetical protein [Proteus mirabilis]
MSPTPAKRVGCHVPDGTPAPPATIRFWEPPHCQCTTQRTSWNRL